MRKPAINPVIKKLRSLAREEGILSVFSDKMKKQRRRGSNGKPYFEKAKDQIVDAVDSVVSGQHVNAYVLLRRPDTEQVFRRVEVKTAFASSGQGDNLDRPGKRIVIKVVKPDALEP